MVGCIDEIFLIGDRTASVTSESLVKEGMWEEVLRKEEDDQQVPGKDLCTPIQGNFFFRNAIRGVSDVAVAGKRFVEGSTPEWVIPHRELK